LTALVVKRATTGKSANDIPTNKEDQHG
jgi:hypothetical protein